MKIRKLNSSGIAQFTQFVQSLRGGEDIQTPKYLLDSEEHSEEIELDLDISKSGFESRYEMGVYLADLFKGKNLTPYIGDVGFWSWFALLWFEELCPVKKGKRKPSKEYNYILSRDYNHRPRHAVYMTWQLVSRYGEDALFLLGKEMSTRGELTEQMMARQENLSSDGVIRLASSLYLDPETRTFKRGAASRKSAGCITRFIRWLDQLKLTYDVFSITKEELEELLPKEFDRFRATGEIS